MTNSSRAGLSTIKQFEGCRLEAYLCPAGVPTIGYGRTTNVGLGQKITQAQADAWLLEEYDAFQSKVAKLLRVPVTANQLGALVSLAYNIGVGALASSTLLRRVNEGKFQEAAAQFARWNKAGGRALAGLTRRRASEAALFAK